MSKERRKRGPVTVGAMLPGILSDLGLHGAAHTAALAERWEEIVGPTIAAHCQPVLMQNGVLEAKVDSSVWCQQLQLQRGEILAALRAALGPNAPKDLRLRVG